MAATVLTTNVAPGPAEATTSFHPARPAKLPSRYASVQGHSTPANEARYTTPIFMVGKLPAPGGKITFTDTAASASGRPLRVTAKPPLSASAFDARYAIARGSSGTGRMLAA